MAFGMLLVMLIGSSQLNRARIHGHLDDARAVNLAGRHRMLTQRFLLAEEMRLRAEERGDPAALARAAGLREDALARLERQHVELFHPEQAPAEARRGLPAGFLPAEARDLADAELHAFLAMARGGLGSAADVAAPLHRSGEVLLGHLEDLVELTEERSRSRLAHLHRIQAVVLGAEVLLLVGLAALLIRPMERQIRAQFDAHAALNRRLESRNAELVKTRGKGAFLAAIVDSSEDAIIGQTLEGRITSWNTGAETTYGHPAEAALGRPVSLLVPPERGDEMARLLERLRDGEHVRGLETVHLRADGERIHVSLTLSPIKDAAGGVIGVSTIARNIDDRVRTEEEVRELNLALTEAMPGIARLGPDGTLERANETFAELVGVTPDELAGRTWEAAVHPEDRLRARAVYASAATSEKAEFEARTAGPGERYALFLLVPRRGPDGEPAGHHFLLRDVSQRKRAEEQLRHDAHHDALTGLANRVLLHQHIEVCYARVARGKGSAFAVLFLDLDRFKVVNDSCGHEVGDELLREVARTLQACVRPEDTVARLGGDEFAILVPDVHDARGAVRVARRVLRELDRPFAVGGREFFTGASVGIALSEHCADGKEMLRDADTAMYRAKREGPGGYALFHPAMHSRLMEELELETELRQGVDRGELVVHYQPIVSLDDGRVLALEALVRWNHPERGLLLPGEFLPVAEDSNLIDAIGLQVVREACLQLGRWRQAGLVADDVTINVNVSGRHFQSGEFFAGVDAALEGLDPRCLNLELTENILLDRDEVTARLEPLVERGVGAEIDDFGTGYCSLGNLHQLPIGGLKIDKSFVDRIETPRGHRDFVRTVLSLADTLEVRVTAEGVENLRQLDLLRGLGCTRAQGFLFSRPVPAAEVESLLSEGRSWRHLVGAG